MTEHPITPPPELLEQWSLTWHKAQVKHVSHVEFVATQAARWGADQELEACVKLWSTHSINWTSSQFRAARRKPPSLKAQALEALQFVDEKLDLPLHSHCNAIHTIRRALEQLDD